MHRASVLFCAILAVSSPARALPDYPEELEKVSGAPCLPHCNVCHRDDNAGSGTVDQPFARNMERLGGLGGSKRSIASALEVLRQQDTDSDGDGVADAEELALGDSPNDAHPPSLCGPEAGCRVPVSASDAWMAALFALLLLRRNRRA